MHDATLVSILEGTGDLFEDHASFFLAEGTPGETLTERATFDVWHDEIGPEALLPIIEGGQNMLMCKHGQRFHLTLNALLIVRIAAMDDLYRHCVLQAFVIGEIDF